MKIIFYAGFYPRSVGQSHFHFQSPISQDDLYISLPEKGIDSNLISQQEGHFVTVLLDTLRHVAHQKHDSHI